MGFKVNLSGAVNTANLEEAGRRVPIMNVETGKPFVSPDIIDGDTTTPGTVCTALVAGSYSKRFKEAQAIATAKEEALGASITDAQREQIRREMWAAVIIEWDLEIDGDPAVAKIFELRAEIYDQMVKASTEHAGFFVARSIN